MEPAKTQATPAASDPLVELQRLRHRNRRWRRGAVVIGVGFAFLFIVSLVQLLATQSACKLLKEAQREAARHNRETADHLRDLRATQQRLRLENKIVLLRKNSETLPTLKDVQNKMAEVEADYQAVLRPLQRELAVAEQLKKELDALEGTDLETKAKLATQIADLQARLRFLEEQQKIDREQMERERVARKLRNETLPAGHDEQDKSCPFPVKKVVDDPFRKPATK
jgi:hypothetical protein